MQAIIKELVIGFSIAAPVGPIGILCIQRTIANGRTSGLLTGLGAATADGIYGAVAGFGLTVISGFLVSHQLWFKVIGGGFLLYLGARTFFSNRTNLSTAENRKGLVSDYSSTVFLTLANPATILSFIALFAGLGIGSTHKEPRSAILMVIGAVAGSSAWWLMLSGGVSVTKRNVSASFLGLINRMSGAVLVTYALLAFASLSR